MGMFLFVGSGLLTGLLLAMWAFVWNFSQWQEVYRCKKCKHIGPWPLMTDSNPCPKCGSKGKSEHTARWLFGWQLKTDSTSQSQPSEPTLDSNLQIPALIFFGIFLCIVISTIF